MADNGKDLRPTNGGLEEVHVVDNGPAATGTAAPIITLESLQRYVESERSRMRHALLWTSTLFLFVVLLVLVMFVAIGINVLRRTRQTGTLVQDVRTRTEVHAVKLEGMSDRIEQVVDIHAGIRETVEDSAGARARQDKIVMSNMERFGKWVVSANERENAREARAIVAMEAQLRQMVDATAGREDELSELKKQYEELQATLSGLAAAPAPVAVAATLEPADEATGAGGPATAEVARADLPEDMFADDWLDTELASAEDLLLEEIGALEGRGPKGEISVVTFPNGDRYEGEFGDGLFNGWGAYYRRNGDRYEGEFRNDMKDGRGTYTYYNGDKFIGEFKNDMKHGSGSMMYMNGNRYVGQFQNDMRNGKGTLNYQDGKQYAGDFKNGLRHGNGVFRFANGDIYKGSFREDLRHGKGSYLYAVGAKYIGDFYEGRRHGKGRYVYQGGEEYIGEFKNGRKDGQGVCVYPNGMKSKGLWREDKFVRRLD